MTTHTKVHMMFIDYYVYKCKNYEFEKDPTTIRIRSDAKGTPHLALLLHRRKKSSYLLLYTVASPARNKEL